MKMLAIGLIGAAALGQSFEVASVKPATPLGPMGRRADRKGGPGTDDPGTYSCQNCPLFWVISEAYNNLQTFEYAGPDWVNDLRFDFAAKVPRGTSQEAFRAMLQNMLAERFKMAAHREKKEMQIYELAVSKNGPKFHEAVIPTEEPKDDKPTGPMKRDADGFPILTRGTTMAAVPGHAAIRSDNQPMGWFAHMLQGQLQDPVVDATGLKAKYDFTLTWAWEEAGATADVYRGEMINAVQAQLGLKLERKKGQAEVLVVDHLEKAPTEN